MIISFILSAVVIFVDQLTKGLIYNKVSVSIIGNFLKIESDFNTGISLGMFEGNVILFILITLPVVGAMIYIICSKKYLNKFNKICLGIILGGTIGNLIDRIFLGGVRDFISMQYFSIFNVADIAITLGVIVFVIGLLVQVYGKKKEAPKEAKEVEDPKLEQLKGLRDELKKSVEDDKKGEDK